MKTPFRWAVPAFLLAGFLMGCDSGSKEIQVKMPEADTPQKKAMMQQIQQQQQQMLGNRVAQPAAQQAGEDNTQK